MTQKNMTPKLFLNKVLGGTATGVVIGLIPNAVLSGILKYFTDIPLAVMLSQVALIFQMATPLLIGALIAMQFGMQPMQIMVTAGAAFVGSGVVAFNPEIGTYIGAGTGDLINTMITAAIAVLLLMLVKDKFGSVAVIAMPILIGCGAAMLGLLILPIITSLTGALGSVINSFTNLQPIIMAILISCSFALLIVTPVSTVAIGLAIQLQGISAGAAAMGVAATTIVLVIHSWKVNESGVTLAVGLGAMKLMMPNLFKYPIIMLPILVTAVVSAIPVALFAVSGTPQSAGFGLVGLVGPLASFDAGLSVPLIIISWFVVPIIAGLIAKIVLEKVMKLYDSKTVFAFQGSN